MDKVNTDLDKFVFIYSNEKLVVGKNKCSYTIPPTLLKKTEPSIDLRLRTRFKRQFFDLVTKYSHYSQNKRWTYTYQSPRNTTNSQPSNHVDHGDEKKQHVQLAHDSTTDQMQVSNINSKQNLSVVAHCMYM